MAMVKNVVGSMFWPETILASSIWAPLHLESLFGATHLKYIGAPPTGRKIILLILAYHNHIKYHTRQITKIKCFVDKVVACSPTACKIPQKTARGIPHKEVERLVLLYVKIGVQN